VQKKRTFFFFTLKPVITEANRDRDINENSSSMERIEQFAAVLKDYPSAVLFSHYKIRFLRCTRIFHKHQRRVEKDGKSLSVMRFWIIKNYDFTSASDQ
jgi:hypothetical protein